MKATFRGEIIADSDNTVEIDGYHYFPPHCVKKSFLRESDFSSFCPAKGRAKYWDLVSGDHVTKNAAFSYPTTEGDMKTIQGRIAFWSNDSALTITES